MNWGQRHFDRLMYREQLRYWREEAIPRHRACPFDVARIAWTQARYAAFKQRIDRGDCDDIVSCFPDKVFGFDIREGALEHDIAYWLGGSEQDRINADRLLYEWIKQRYPSAAGQAAASWVWIAIRVAGRRKRFFCYTDRGEGA